MNPTVHDYLSLQRHGQCHFYIAFFERIRRVSKISFRLPGIEHHFKSFLLHSTFLDTPPASIAYYLTVYDAHSVNLVYSSRSSNGRR